MRRWNKYTSRYLWSCYMERTLYFIPFHANHENQTRALRWRCEWEQWHVYGIFSLLRETEGEQQPAKEIC